VSEGKRKGHSCRSMNTSILRARTPSTQQVEELTAQLKGVIEGLGGSIAKTEYWGVKSLSYRLRKNRKSHFTLMNVQCAAGRDQRDRAAGASQ